jgi:hypothetical protein
VQHCVAWQDLSVIGVPVCDSTRLTIVTPVPVCYAPADYHSMFAMISGKGSSCIMQAAWCERQSLWISDVFHDWSMRQLHMICCLRGSCMRIIGLSPPVEIGMALLFHLLVDTTHATISSCRRPTSALGLVHSLLGAHRPGHCGAGYCDTCSATDTCTSCRILVR